MSGSQGWKSLGLGIKDIQDVLKILKNVVVFLVERKFECIWIIYRSKDYRVVQVIFYKNPLPI